MTRSIPKAAGQGDRRTQARNAQRQAVATHGRALGADYVPGPPEEHWTPRAAELWDAVRNSGQRTFMEPSDWAMLKLVCDELSEYQRSPRRSSQMLMALKGLMSDLMLSEGERRRLSIELDRTPEETGDSAGVVAMRDLLAKRSQARKGA